MATIEMAGYPVETFILDGHECILIKMAARILDLDKQTLHQWELRGQVNGYRLPGNKMRCYRLKEIMDIYASRELKK